MFSRTGQCFCGSVVKTRSRNEWLFWLDNHHCPGALTEEPEEESKEFAVVHGDAQVERSYQWNGRYDGEYQYTPEVQSRRPAGFQVQ